MEEISRERQLQQKIREQQLATASSLSVQRGGGSAGVAHTSGTMGGGLFGSTPAPSTGGLFGSTNSASSFTGALFGSNAPAPSIGTLFGSTAVPTSGGLFGSTPAPASVGPSGTPGK